MGKNKSNVQPDYGDMSKFSQVTFDIAEPCRVVGMQVNLAGDLQQIVLSDLVLRRANCLYLSIRLFGLW